MSNIMTDNEIIKALKCCKKAKINQDCVVLKCPFSTEYGCNIGLENLRNEALNLINRQKAEIEELKNAGDNKTKEILRHISAIEELHEKIKIAKSEAIKEFAERLKETITKAINTYYNSNGGGYYLAEDVIEDINNLVKEMMGEI